MTFLNYLMLYVCQSVYCSAPTLPLIFRELSAFLRVHDAAFLASGLQMCISTFSNMSAFQSKIGGSPLRQHFVGTTDFFNGPSLNLAGDSAICGDAFRNQFKKKIKNACHGAFLPLLPFSFFVPSFIFFFYLTTTSRNGWTRVSLIDSGTFEGRTTQEAFSGMAHIAHLAECHHLGLAAWWTELWWPFPAPYHRRWFKSNFGMSLKPSPLFFAVPNWKTRFMCLHGDTVLTSSIDKGSSRHESSSLPWTSLPIFFLYLFFICREVGLKDSLYAVW